MVDDLLISIMEEARWHVARRTYGSSHNTLIGLVVDWWITIGRERGRRHLAMEPAPQVDGTPPYEPGKRGSDAILVDEESAFGVVEVETANPRKKLESIGCYLNHAAWRTLQLGVLVAYPAAVRQALPFEQFIRDGGQLIATHPDKELIILALDKEWGREPLSPLFRGRDWHEGRFNHITGAHLRNENNRLVVERHSRSLTSGL